MAKVTIRKGKPHDYVYKFSTNRIHQVGGFIVFREPFEMVAVCTECGDVKREYCIGGYAPIGALGGEDDSEH